MVRTRFKKLPATTIEMKVASDCAFLGSCSSFVDYLVRIYCGQGLNSGRINHSNTRFVFRSTGQKKTIKGKSYLKISDRSRIGWPELTQN